MERNENNNFRILFPFFVLEFQWREWKIHSLIWEFKVGGNGMSRRKHPFLFIPLKSQIFIPPEIGEEWEGIELDLMIFLLKLTKYPYIFNPLF